MHRTSLARVGFAALTLGLWAAPGFSQTVLLEETFDQGMSDWTGTGMWHWLSDADPCGQSLVPYPSSQGAARFGAADCTFSDGNNTVSGALISPPVQLPVNGGNVSLTYYQFIDTEQCNHGWDLHWISISTDGGANWEVLSGFCQGGEFVGEFGSWRQFKIDLSSYSGQEVRVSFDFDSTDGAQNNGLGWMLDDILITGGGCEAESFCFGYANSFSNGGASIGYQGSKRVQDNDFTLTVDSAPPGQFGLFFYGSGTGFQFAGEGALCVSAGNHSLVRLPAGQIDSAGHMEHLLDIPGSLSGPNAIVAGSVWNFQFWFRDQPTPGFSTFNFSDGLRVGFCP